MIQQFTFGYLSKKKEPVTQKDICTTPHIHCSIIYNSQDKEAVCVHPWMNGLKKWIKIYVYIYTHTHVDT